MMEKQLDGVDIETRLREQATMLVRYMMLTKGVSYIELAERLSNMGVVDSPRNLSNKVRRGNFGIVTLLLIMEALGVDEINLRVIN